MSHTPGPWKVGKVNHKKQCVDIDTNAADVRTGYSNWQALARAYGIQDNPAAGSEIMQANARLIAAAPMMLQALRAIAAEKWVSGKGIEGAIRQAEAAIQIATGGA